jgi:hypothetical protein
MRITPQSTRRPRTIGCDYRHDDGSLCPARITGEEDERLDKVRWRAREQGWACNNPGPGRPASDLCPVHRETGEEAS